MYLKSIYILPEVSEQCRLPVHNNRLQMEKVQLAVFIPPNILASYIFPLKRALTARKGSRVYELLF
jgi:hypothetical protein